MCVSYQSNFQHSSYLFNLAHQFVILSSCSHQPISLLILFQINLPSSIIRRLGKCDHNISYISMCRFGIEGPVYLTPGGEKTREWFVDEQQQKLKKIDGSVSYSVLQTVRIHINVTTPQTNREKLQLTLIWRQIGLRSRRKAEASLPSNVE